MLNPNSNKLIEDSDNTDTEDKAYENDFKKIIRKAQFEKVPMIQDDKGFIYYVLFKDGEILIMEGNPKNAYEKNHVAIYSMKVEGILAFNGDGENF